MNKSLFFERLAARLPATLLSTLALALLLAVAEHMHWFNWADVVTLQIAGAQGKHGDSDKKSKVLAEATSLTIVKIGDDPFEKFFNEQSPLNRDRLVEIVQAIAQSRPKVLALDIDITPTLQEVASRGTAPRLIDQALASLASSGMSVILPLSISFTSRNGNLLSLNLVNQFEWVKRMCRSGVLFASPDVLSHLGTVTKLRKATNATNFISLSELAYLRYKGGSNQNLCGSILQQPDVLRYQEFQTLTNVNQEMNLDPINMRALSNAFLSEVSTDIVPSNVSSKQTVGFSQKIPLGGIVMVGGAYRGIDMHLTPKGNVYGVELHAAMLASHARPVGDISWYVSLVVELIVGTLIGFLFMALWWIYDQSGKRYDEYFERFDRRTRSDSEASLQTRTLALIELIVRRLGPLFCLLVVCATPFVMTYLALFALSSLIDGDRWINPAPFIFGLFLHSILVRVEVLQEGLKEQQRELKRLSNCKAKNRVNHSTGVLEKLKHHLLDELGAVIVIFVAAVILFIQLSSGPH